MQTGVYIFFVIKLEKKIHYKNFKLRLIFYKNRSLYSLYTFCLIFLEKTNHLKHVHTIIIAVVSFMED